MKSIKKIISLALCACIVAMSCVSAFALSDTGRKTVDFNLRFDEDGNFRLMQIADIQDYHNVDKRCLELLKLAIQEYKPDLLVLTGDNTISTTLRFEKTIEDFIPVFGNTPFAVIFGNHDSETGPSRSEQYKLYIEHGAIDYDNNFSDVNLSGVGQGCLPILDNSGKHVAWNLFLLDSGSNDDNGGYGKPGYSDTKNYNNETGYYQTCCVESPDKIPIDVSRGR